MRCSNLLPVYAMGDYQFFELSNVNKNYITGPTSASESAISLKHELKYGQSSALDSYPAK